MSVNKATASVILVSATTLLLCLFAMAKIYTDVQNIWIEFDNEIDSFKVPFYEILKYKYNVFR